MGFKCGIIGLPNVGKSTLFNALTKGQAEASNFPFCTIEPNVGMVAVPDARLAAIAGIVQPKRVLPTYMQFVDVAGLVKGAANGEGLGNQFLATIRECDAIAHVVRFFKTESVVHVDGRVDPIADLEIIELELALADLHITERAVERLQKRARTGERSAKPTITLLQERIIPALQEGIAIRKLSLSTEEQSLLAPYACLTQKPSLLVANVDEVSFLETSKPLAVLQEHADRTKQGLVLICAHLEQELSEIADPVAVQAYLASLHLQEPGLHRLIREGYRLLRLQSFFTAGEKEVRAWTIPMQSTAAQAAGAIHSDFEKGFIRAEVISFEDFLQYRGVQGAKAAAKWRLEGRQYLMRDGDIVHFRFNV